MKLSEEEREAVTKLLHWEIEQDPSGAIARWMLFLLDEGATHQEVSEILGLPFDLVDEVGRIRRGIDDEAMAGGEVGTE